MMKRNLIKVFRFDSILVQMLLVFFTLLCVSFFLLTAVNRQFYERNRLRDDVDAAYAAAGQIRTGLEHTLSLGQLLLNDFFLYHRAGAILYDQEDGNYRLEASLTLEQMAADNDLLLAADLYLVPRDLLLTSGRSYDQPQRSARQELYREHASAGRGAELCQTEAELFLLLDYPAAAPIAVLCLELDQQRLYADCTGGGISREGLRLLAFTGQQEQLFPGYSPAWEGPLLLTEAASPGDYPLYRLAATEDVYVTVQEAAGLKALAVVLLSRQATRIPYSALVGSALPPFAALLVIAALGFWAFVKRIYDPLQQLIDAGAVPGQERELLRVSFNEIDYLDRAYRQQSAELSQMDGMLASAAGPLLEHLLQMLLWDEQTDRQRLVCQIQRLDAPLCHCRQFAVLALHRQGNPDGDPVLRAMEQAELQAWALAYWRQAPAVEACLVLAGGRERFAVILGLQPSGAADLAGLYEEFWRQWRQRPRASGLAAGSGGLCQQLSELYYCYRRASAQLNVELYYVDQAQIGEEEPAAPSLAPAFLAQVERLCLELQQGDDQAEEKLWRLLAEQLQDPNSPPPQALLPLVKDTLVELLLRCGMSDSALLSRDGAFYSSTLTVSDSQTLAREEIRSCLRQAVAQLRHAGRQKQYSYVEEARQYISQHYFDNMLSLESVSQHVGVSKYYLSSLFNDYCPPGFAEYLRLYRLDRAKELLQKTDYSASEIGLKTGFTSVQNFYLVFKKNFGQAPGAWRKAWREGGSGHERT